MRISLSRLVLLGALPLLAACSKSADSTTAAAAVMPGYPAMATTTAYLPNQAPADPANPYAGTTYRQRSW